MDKLSSYQKLKQHVVKLEKETTELKSHIYSLITKPECIDTLMIKKVYQTGYEIEKSNWIGEPEKFWKHKINH
jgi:hypothetical protein